MSSSTEPTKLVDHLFRHEYGKMVAVLSRFLGLTHLDAVEDIVQETFIQAMHTWRPDTLPDNPSAWLISVAKRKAIDYIRKSKSDKSREVHVSLSGPGSAYIEELFMETEIADSQLRMILACCHPRLSTQDQIALTLKIVSGFSLKEIAKGLLSQVETIKKRIQRARKFIITNDIKLEIPSGGEIKSRLESVHMVLYLLFNEGYYASVNEAHIRRDLCFEAMRLCRITTEHKLTRQPDNLALMALMCYHASRFDSRLDTDGQIILLADQDRTSWNQQLIHVGHYHMFHACKDGFSSVYHWEAAISSEHASTRLFEDTNWELILHYYRNIYALKPSEQVLMNQVVVLMQLKRLDEAEELFLTVEANDSEKVLYHSIGSELYKQKNDAQKALEHLTQAEQSSPTQAELSLIVRKKNNIREIQNGEWRMEN